MNGLQSIPRESNDKDVAAMLDGLTIEAKEESFVIVLQHGGNDVTCKRSISYFYHMYYTVVLFLKEALSVRMLCAPSNRWWSKWRTSSIFVFCQFTRENNWRKLRREY